MRRDVSKAVSQLTDEEVFFINKSEMARRMGCDRRTVKRYIKEKDAPASVRAPVERAKLTDGFEGVIKEKIDKYGASAMAVYKFIEKKGYRGRYGTVANYVRKHRTGERRKATIRFETVPGLQAQVDWKESVKMTNRKGDEMTVNIFLMVLGYSRLKFTKLTYDRTQKTLFGCIAEALSFFGGVPQEILFDNMSTVVDRARTTFQGAVFNEGFRAFADDAGFEPVACRAYRAKTKGKVESLAKLTGRLRVYNGEFDTYEELEAIAAEFMDDVNDEVSQSTGETPSERFGREKEHLRPLPNNVLLLSHTSSVKEYKVTKESMVSYKGRKYSVPIHYTGKSVTVKEENDGIGVYYGEDRISAFGVSGKRLNYKKEHVREILASDALAHLSPLEIDEFIENNLSAMDTLLE